MVPATRAGFGLGFRGIGFHGFGPFAAPSARARRGLPRQLRAARRRFPGRRRPGPGLGRGGGSPLLGGPFPLGARHPGPASDRPRPPVQRSRTGDGPIEVRRNGHCAPRQRRCRNLPNQRLPRNRIGRIGGPCGPPRGHLPPPDSAIQVRIGPMGGTRRVVLARGREQRRTQIRPQQNST